MGPTISYHSLTLATLAENLALDEALLRHADEGSGEETLRTWEWPHDAVVLGAGCKLLEDVNEEACENDNVPILRRSSGGGTVLLGRGCLCYSLVLALDREPGLRGIRSSYQVILEKIRLALSVRAPGIALQGISDLALGDRKCSGNSQQRKSRFLLHHGVMLHAFDCARIGRYLQMPSRQPAYRAGRDHEAFLTNLPIAAIDLAQLLREAWQGWNVPLPLPEASVLKLVREKYLDPAWIRRH